MPGSFAMVPALRISRRPWDEVGAQSRAQSPTVSCQESGNGIKSHGILNRKRHLFLLVCAFSSFHYSVEMSIGFFLANGKEPFFCLYPTLCFVGFLIQSKELKDCTFSLLASISVTANHSSSNCTCSLGPRRARLV